MLILSRRIDESLRIGDDVTITILEIKGTQVRIGIDAPSDVSVHREEVYSRITEEEAGRVSSSRETSDGISVRYRRKILRVGNE